MNRHTKLLILAAVGAIASEKSLIELRKRFDFGKLIADNNEGMTDLATGRDGLPIVEHLTLALAEVFPEYKRKSAAR